MKYLPVFICFLFFFKESWSQEFIWKNELKHELSYSDMCNLQIKSVSCFQINPEFDFNISKYDLISSSKDTIPEEASSLKKINKLERQLEGNLSDVDVLLDIGLTYKRLGKKGEGISHFNMALNLLKNELLNKPEDIELYLKIVKVYENIENFNLAEYYLQKVLKKYENNKKILEKSIDFYISQHRYDIANKYIKLALKHYSNYEIFYIYHFLSIFNQFNNFSKEKKLKAITSKKNNDLFDLNLFEKKFKKNPKNQTFALLYNLNKTYSGIYKITVENCVYSKNCQIDPKCINKIAECESFFEHSLNDENIKDKYIYYLSLANIKVLKGDYLKAEEIYTKAIKLRTPEKSNFNMTAETAYNNKLTVNLIEKDTAEMINILNEKIRKHPLIDPNEYDYIMLARYEILQKRYFVAENLLIDALNINPRNPLSYRGMAICSFIKSENNLAKTFVMNSEKYKKEKSFYNKLLMGIIELFDQRLDYSYKNLKMAYIMNDKDVLLNQILNKYYKKR